MKYFEYKPSLVICMDKGYSCNDRDYFICRAFGACGISFKTEEQWQSYRQECLEVCRRLVKDGYAKAVKDEETGITYYFPTDAGEKIIEQRRLEIQQELKMFARMSKEKKKNIN